MTEWVLEQRFRLGGTEYAQRMADAIAKHPEISEVVEIQIATTGKKGNYAADLRFVYRSERELRWAELCSVASHVPLYLPVGKL